MRCVDSSMSRPSASKKRISTASGSPGASRTVIPPRALPLRTWKRVRGTVASSTSSTFTPARLTPPMTARFSARATRLVSRLVVTVAPFLSAVPYAVATRIATSGVTSTLASPRIPRRPKRVRAPRLSHTIDELTTAPFSTVLNGYTLTPGLMTACSPTKHSSPTTTPSSMRAWARRSVDRPITQPRRRALGPT